MQAKFDIFSIYFVMDSSRIIDRFDLYVKINGLNDNKVTKECGLSVGALGQARKGKCDLGKKSIDKILIRYQDLNRVWLLTGEGDMLVPQAQIVNENVKGNTFNGVHARNFLSGNGNIQDGVSSDLLAKVALLEQENEHLREQVSSLQADKSSLGVQLEAANARIDRLMEKL